MKKDFDAQIFKIRKIEKHTFLFWDKWNFLFWKPVKKTLIKLFTARLRRTLSFFRRETIPNLN
tara:strand:+ start:3668 stop:3856 length:189 start_codon:yes stop_codon:yes gene_type:complete